MTYEGKCNKTIQYWWDVEFGNEMTDKRGKCQKYFAVNRDSDKIEYKKALESDRI